MDDKLNWMVEQARYDDMNLSYDEIAIILATRSGVSVFSDAEVDYVMELSNEWERD